MALGAIRALWEEGLRVPEDVSVMGVDGLALGEFLVPQLATIRQSIKPMALRSVQLLLGAMEDGKKATYETVPFEVQKRESIRKI
jgi:LacI family transcriptional regulator